jgi:6-pyruvoyltetrahydropterin/6-carboxytetrahydropterin synthase
LAVTTLLRRTTRFAVRPGGEIGRSKGVNGYAGSPPMAMVGLSPIVTCTVECRGEPDPTSGYLINIKTIDDAVHATVRPRIERALAAGGTATPEAPVPSAPHDPSDLGSLLADSLTALTDALPVPVTGLTLGLSPYHAVAMTTDAPQLATVLLRFDFAAAHRLHVAEWDEAANRDYFGKCNNANGHGHNYQLEVRVAVPTGQLGAFSTDALERTVTDTVIDRFDHKHLNLDTAEFADGTGLIPTVENIARVCYDLLAGPIGRLGDGVSLRSVRVWETDRTSSEYPA